MNFCVMLALYEMLLNHWVLFGPELPNGEPDPAFDQLVESMSLFKETQLAWQETPGSENMLFCLK